MGGVRLRKVSVSGGSTVPYNTGYCPTSLVAKHIAVIPPSRYQYATVSQRQLCKGSHTKLAIKARLNVMLIAIA